MVPSSLSTAPGELHSAPFVLLHFSSSQILQVYFSPCPFTHFNGRKAEHFFTLAFVLIHSKSACGVQAAEEQWKTHWEGKADNYALFALLWSLGFGSLLLWQLTAEEGRMCVLNWLTWPSPLCCGELCGVGVKTIRGLFLGHSPREKRHSFNTRGRRGTPTRNRASPKTPLSYAEETETQNKENRAGTVWKIHYKIRTRANIVVWGTS